MNEQTDIEAQIDELIDCVIEYVESDYDSESRQDFMYVRDQLIRMIENVK